jgi:trehalose/maltose hydrolase-like predicted phosphorylase
MIDILTGRMEQHISADIAYAVWQYWRATGDDAFFVDAGAEIVIETARFWASRAVAEADGKRHIRRVIRPDEYHEDVDDNAFTQRDGALEYRARARDHRSDAHALAGARGHAVRAACAGRGRTYRLARRGRTMSFAVRWRGQPVQVRIAGDNVQVAIADVDPVRIRIGGQTHNVQGGSALNVRCETRAMVQE